MTAQRYVHDILQPHVLPLMQRLPGAIFQQDNARPYTGRVSQDCLHTVPTLPRPARSQICLQSSISENIWDDWLFDDRVHERREKADMILAHGATDCNGRATQRLYAEKHPVRRTPCSYHVCSPTPAIMWDRFIPEGSTYRIERGNCTRYGRDHSQFKYTRYR
ncbi:transposable element Tcb2 transposase [Trichonephila clavipes]|nr:transposable element Tcb2 transposase [Trichonephila clavipes]